MAPGTGTGTRDGAPPLLQVEDLVVHYHIRGAGTVVRSHETVHAVDGVSFTLDTHQTLGLVGESGCGKSTTGRNVLLLERPTSGRILFKGQDLAALGARQLTELRRNMQIVFQDPIGALNPRHTVGQLIGEPLRVHDKVPKKKRRERVEELLELVGLPVDAVSRFPHEFSGGQCQRIGIARSLAVEPSLLVLDEPVSALDVSIQAQILQLLNDIQVRLGLSYLFIAHDLAVVGEMSDRVAVMYLGKIVETGLAGRIANAARHPYTHILWSSLVEKQSRESSRVAPYPQAGRWGVFDFVRPVSGCRFSPRCTVFESNGRPAKCTDPETEPQLRDIGDGHYVACHFPL
jgi:oligopeptide/dipeptide ABC transporter ATP-binding protein